MQVAEKIEKCLCKYGCTTTLAKKYKSAPDSIRESLDQWTKREFCEQDAIVFVGAAGIAVRAIAPYVKSKSEDPAVIVADEQGRYCIPLLSGHIGGANELAELIGAEVNAIPVITTATDLNGKWAVDVFAAKNGLAVSDMGKAKEISARILSGERVSVYIEESCGWVRGELPGEVRRWKKETKEEAGEPDIAVGIYKNLLWSRTLYLIPQAVVLGIGCKKGTGAGKIEEKVLRTLEKGGIFSESICMAASIDLKKDEAGIRELCGKYGWGFETFSAEELEKAEGEFAGSGFVKQITGVDNVCERSAVRGSGGGNVILAKQAEDGVTVAAAERGWGVRFE